MARSARSHGTDGSTILAQVRAPPDVQRRPRGGRDVDNEAITSSPLECVGRADDQVAETVSVMSGSTSWLSRLKPARELSLRNIHRSSCCPAGFDTHPQLTNSTGVKGVIDTDISLHLYRTDGPRVSRGCAMTARLASQRKRGDSIKGIFLVTFL